MIIIIKLNTFVRMLELFLDKPYLGKITNFYALNKIGNKQHKFNEILIFRKELILKYKFYEYNS